MKAKSHAHLCNNTSDVAHTDQAHRLALEFIGAEFLTDIPISLDCFIVAGNKIFCQRQDHGDGVLGNGTRVCTRRNDNRDAQFCRRLCIHRVKADAVPCNDL